MEKSLNDAIYLPSRNYDKIAYLDGLVQQKPVSLLKLTLSKLNAVSRKTKIPAAMSGLVSAGPCEPNQNLLWCFILAASVGSTTPPLRLRVTDERPEKKKKKKKKKTQFDKLACTNTEILYFPPWANDCIRPGAYGSIWQGDPETQDLSRWRTFCTTHGPSTSVLPAL